ncbi:uncharacterized protein LOC134728118 [Mytilus trossulus]|uniref:uncharacterized protein LOC134728118 n=1 Tax=Mytilus trossulus TaxID=6551 RepID=UPI003004F809
MEAKRMKAKLAMVTHLPAGNDVIISYDPEDRNYVIKIRDKLKEAGIAVWVETYDLGGGANVFSKVGQAVVDAKIFFYLISTDSVKSKLCQDQLALAYVSKKSILPVAIDDEDDVSKIMDNGMRLQLAGFEWSFLDREIIEDGLPSLVARIKDMLADYDSSNRDEETKKKTEEKKRYLRSAKSRSRIKASRIHLQDGKAYWTNTFGAVANMSWERFKAKLLEDFKLDFEQTFGEEDTEWLLAILHRELMVEHDENVSFENFIAFCTIDEKVLPVWSRIQEQARESYAMREVFDMDSSVRVDAIENLGKFKSLTVIGALRDLLADKDANVQAVAIISLARTNSTDIETIVALRKCLRMKDRVVREAACLALGHLGVEAVIEELVNLWRNDIISNVREAALVALNKIGGPKANEAIRVTEVLEKEIRSMKSA